MQVQHPRGGIRGLRQEKYTNRDLDWTVWRASDRPGLCHTSNGHILHVGGEYFALFFFVCFLYFFWGGIYITYTIYKIHTKLWCRKPNGLFSIYIPKISSWLWTTYANIQSLMNISDSRPLHSFRRHLGCGAVAAKITANIWDIV